MRRLNVNSGVRWESEVGYSRLVKVGRQIYVTGTTAMGPDGVLVGEGDARAQTLAALRNIETALAQVGSGLTDIVRTRMYVTNIQRDLRDVGRAHRELLGEILPATTLVEVSGLVDERLLIEIEADAIKGAGDAVVGERPRIVEGSFEEGSDLAEMLRSVDLPVPAADDKLEMLKAYVGGELVGCVGTERFGDAALMHSLVVIRQAKSQGVGRALVQTVLARLRQGGVKRVFLVTADTAQYFGYLGFDKVQAHQVDPEVLESPEVAAYDLEQVTLMCHQIEP